MKAKKVTSIFLALIIMIAAFATLSAPASAAGAYIDVDKAVAYATKWTDNSGNMSGTYNPEYNIYKKPNPPAYYGYDCANFVSQCLYAGGLKETSGWARVKKGWNYKDVTGGVAWVSAKELYNYLKGKGYTNEPVNSSLSNIHKGDVVFMDFDGKDGVDHSTICTALSSGKPYYSAHSKWRRNYEYKSSDWNKAYVVHMSSCQVPEKPPAPAVTQKSYTVTSSNGVKVRSGAGTGYSEVGGVAKGSVIKYTQTKSANGYTWMLIESGSTFTSGSWGKNIGYWAAMIDSTPAPAVTQKTYTIQSSSGAKTRTGAGTGYSEVGGVAKGSVIKYTQTKSANGYTWMLIESGSTFTSGSWGKNVGYWTAMV